LVPTFRSRADPQLLAQKSGFQMTGDEQIAARFMIEQMQEL
jgi:hypothetical protein